MNQAKAKHTAATKAFQFAILHGNTTDLARAMDAVEVAHRELSAAARAQMTQLQTAAHAYTEAA